jgi:hypothetical protein
LGDFSLTTLPKSTEPAEEDTAVVDQFIEASRQIVPSVQVSLAKRIVRPGSNRVLCLAARTSMPLNEDEIASVSNLALRLSDGTNVVLSLSFFDDAAAGALPYSPASFSPERYQPRNDFGLPIIVLLTSISLGAALFWLLANVPFRPVLPHSQSAAGGAAHLAHPAALAIPTIGGPHTVSGPPAANNVAPIAGTAGVRNVEEQTALGKATRSTGHGRSLARVLPPFRRHQSEPPHPHGQAFLIPPPPPFIPSILVPAAKPLAATTSSHAESSGPHTGTTVPKPTVNKIPLNAATSSATAKQSHDILLELPLPAAGSSRIIFAGEPDQNVDTAPPQLERLSIPEESPKQGSAPLPGSTTQF